MLRRPSIGGSRGAFRRAAAASPPGGVSSPPAAGDVLELKIERLAFPDGQGVARAENGMVILVQQGEYRPGRGGAGGWEPQGRSIVHPYRRVCLRAGDSVAALPGATVRAKVGKVGARSVEAVAVEQVVPPEDSVAPPCPHASHCSGCALQSLEYERQLQLKEGHVVESLVRIGGFSREEVQTSLRAMIRSPQQLGYRNKTSFSWGPKVFDPARGKLSSATSALGLYRRGSADVVLPIDQCLLQDDTSNLILAAAREAAEELGLRAWSAKGPDAGANGAILRYLRIRRGTKEPGGKPQYMVHLETARPPAKEGKAAKGKVSELAAKLVAAFPGVVTSVVHT